ncbi:MAG: S4 domain-containing protein, partial [Steroidobacteraceae bacterium]
MNLETHDVEIPLPLAGERLDVALAQLLPQFSRSRLQRWIDEGRVTLDGRTPSRREAVTAGQRVRIEALFEADDRVAAGAASVPFEIVH